jgi:hypothetical protein
VKRSAEDFDYSSAAVPPGAVFVAADEPLLVFPSAAAAATWIEPIDVENGVYPAAYGPDGEHYQLGTQRNRVVIERTGEPNKPEDLRVLLVRYLESTGQAFENDAPTSELVQQVWRWESEFWQENDPYGDRFSKPVPRSCCVAFILIPATLLYVFMTRDWTAIPFVIVMTLLFWGVTELARRKADRMDFRQR